MGKEDFWCCHTNSSCWSWRGVRFLPLACSLCGLTLPALYHHESGFSCGSASSQGPYGLSLIVRNILIPWPGSQTASLLMIIARLIGIAATIPALLLYREFYGRDRRIPFQWLTWAYALAVVERTRLVGNARAGKYDPFSRDYIGSSGSVGVDGGSTCRIPTPGDQRTKCDLHGAGRVLLNVCLRSYFAFAHRRYTSQQKSHLDF